MPEFNASINLSAERAISQANKFSAAVTKSSVELNKFQKEVSATSQGSKNVFLRHDKALNSLNQTLRKTIASVNGNNKSFSKLSESQQKAVRHVISLNEKYDESARALNQVRRVRNELNLVVTSGLKTQKEANRIFTIEEQKIRRSTQAYKEAFAARKKSILNRKKESKQLNDVRAKYDKEFAIKRKLAGKNRELLILEKAGIISGKQRIAMLSNEKMAIKQRNAERARSIGLAKRFVVTARAISVASRIFLGVAFARAIGQSVVNLEKMAEGVGLLKQKLELLTGDVNAFDNLFAVTQEVGIRLEDAGKIMTRFAVVTNMAFDSKTIADWVGTITKSARATGTSTQELSGALIQITQAMSAGRLMGDEYRSVTENLPLLTIALRKLFKDSNKSLKELSSEGKITTEKLVKAFEILKNDIEGIPGTVGTIEAKIGSMTAAWQKFVHVVLDSNVSGTIAEFITMELNAATFFIEDMGRRLEERGLSDLDKKIKIINDAIIEKNKEIATSGIDPASVAGLDRFIQNITMNAQAIDGVIVSAATNMKDLIVLLDKFNGEKTKIQGTDEASIREEEAKEKKLAATRQANLEKEKDRAFALFQEFTGHGKRQKIITSFDEDIRKVFEMIEKAQKGEAGGLSPERARLSLKALLQKRNDDLEKLGKDEISQALRLKNLKANVNEEALEAELMHQNKFEKAEKAHLARLIKIESLKEEKLLKAKKAGTIGIDEKSIELEAERRIKQSGLKKAREIQVEVESLTDKILDLGDAAQTIITSDDKSPLAIFDAKIESNAIKVSEQLEKLVRVYGELKEAGKATSEVTADYQDTMNKLNDSLIVMNEQAREQLIGKLANEFSTSTAATIEYDDALIRLNQTQQVLTMSTEEYEFQLDRLKTKLRDAVDLYQAQTGELGIAEQATKGAAKSLQEYADSFTVYEEIQGMTTNALSSMEDALVEFATTGEISFSDMVDSIISDLARMIIKMQITIPIANALNDALANSSSTGGGLFGILGGIFGGVSGSNVSESVSINTGASIAPQGFDFSSIPKFEDGIDFVPSDQLAFLHRGEKVLTASENKTGDKNDSDVDIVINNYTGQQTNAKESSGGGGKRLIEITVGNAMQSMVRNGSMDSTLGQFTGQRGGINRG